MKLNSNASDFPEVVYMTSSNAGRNGPLTICSPQSSLKWIFCALLFIGVTDINPAIAVPPTALPFTIISLTAEIEITCRRQDPLHLICHGTAPKDHWFTFEPAADIMRISSPRELTLESESASILVRGNSFKLSTYSDWGNIDPDHRNAPTVGPLNLAATSGDEVQFATIWISYPEPQ